MEGIEYDSDHWSPQEIIAILKKLEYKGYVKIMYLDPERDLKRRKVIHKLLKLFLERSVRAGHAVMGET